MPDVHIFNSGKVNEHKTNIYMYVCVCYTRLIHTGVLYK